MAHRLLATVASLAFLLTPKLSVAQEHDHQHDKHPAGSLGKLGMVNFPSSARSEAKPPFLRGIALLHSFEYDDAAEAFRAAEARDPKFALAHWMEALTQRQPLWGSENIVAARKALVKLGPTRSERLSRAGDARERAYGAAIEALFADTTDDVRARAFADSMRGVARAYPEDLEAAAFASLALQGETQFLPRSQQEGIYAEASALAERVFKANPNHPGAAHYLIHAYDDPARAAQGLAAARAYAKIAPASEHALHMPSHVFVHLGLWDDMAASNEASFNASLAKMRSRAEADLHAAHWLHYAYVQQGRLDAARKLETHIAALVKGRHPAVTDSTYDADFFYGRGDRALSMATLLNDWRNFPVEYPALVGADSDAVPPPADWAGQYALYLRAAAAAHNGDPAPALRIARSFHTAADTLKRGRPWMAFTSVQLEGLAALARRDTAAAIARFAQAAKLQELTRTSGPPLVQSSNELLGATLLAHGQPADAAKAFEAALVRTPNRAEALLGLARARRAAGDTTGARSAYAQLLANWKHADSSLPMLAEVRAGARGDAR